MMRYSTEKRDGQDYRIYPVVMPYLGDLRVSAVLISPPDFFRGEYVPYLLDLLMLPVAVMTSARESLLKSQPVVLEGLCMVTASILAKEVELFLSPPPSTGEAEAYTVQPKDLSEALTTPDYGASDATVPASPPSHMHYDPALTKGKAVLEEFVASWVARVEYFGSLSSGAKVVCEGNTARASSAALSEAQLSHANSPHVEESACLRRKQAAWVPAPGELDMFDQVTFLFNEGEDVCGGGVVAGQHGIVVQVVGTTLAVRPLALAPQTAPPPGVVMLALDRVRKVVDVPLPTWAVEAKGARRRWLSHVENDEPSSDESIEM